MHKGIMKGKLRASSFTEKILSNTLARVIFAWRSSPSRGDKFFLQRNHGLQNSVQNESSRYETN